jgi:hypothetical protein
VVEVVEEPDAGLAGVFLEGDGVAVDDFHLLVVDGSCVDGGVPSSAPMTRLFRCLEGLTLLKWSTMERRTRGCTLVWVMGALLMI